MSALPCPRSGATTIHLAGEATSQEQKSSVDNRARTSPPEAPRETCDGVIVHGHVAASWEMRAR
jgi:hypothetical protein